MGEEEEQEEDEEDEECMGRSVANVSTKNPIMTTFMSQKSVAFMSFTCKRLILGIGPDLSWRS